MEPEVLLRFALLAVAGFGAGVVNTVAGGGSTLTLPALVFCGLTPSDANATNRVAILLQNVVGAAGYRKRGVGGLRLGIGLGLLACPGALVGAYVAGRLVEDAMLRPIIAVVILGAGAVLVLGKKPEERAEAARSGLALGATFVALGFYGGFIQVGIGILILSALVRIGGRGLIEANGAKVVIVLVYTIAALAVFGGLGEVDWTVGLVMALGNMAGAWTGTILAVSKRGETWIRRIVVVVIGVSAIKLLWPA